MNESNFRIIHDSTEAIRARWIARREFMARLAPTGLTIDRETQDRWWGFITDEAPNTMQAIDTRKENK